MRHPVNDLFPIMENEGVWKSALEEYLDDGGDVNHHNVFLSSPHLGKTLLIRAIELNNVPIIKKLLDVKANPNICHSKTLQSPLSIMLSNVNPDHDTTTICKILLDAGADADKVDEFTFMSPLYHMLSTPVTYNAHHVCFFSPFFVVFFFFFFWIIWIICFIVPPPTLI
jgi:ankyrin repeat protein